MLKDKTVRVTDELTGMATEISYSVEGLRAEMAEKVGERERSEGKTLAPEAREAIIDKAVAWYEENLVEGLQELQENMLVDAMHEALMRDRPYLESLAGRKLDDYFFSKKRVRADWKEYRERELKARCAKV